MTEEDIAALLDDWLETEFTFIQLEGLPQRLAGLPAAQRDFLLDWTRRAAAAQPHVAHRFVEQASHVIGQAEPHLVEAWLLFALELYDSEGQRAAMEVLRDPQSFLQEGLAQGTGALFSDIEGVLGHFLHGLSGRRLQLRQGPVAMTDTSSIWLPRIFARHADAAANFRLAKATAVFLWAQTRFGTFLCPDLAERLAATGNAAHARHQFLALEAVRLEAAIARQLPGLGRQLAALRQHPPPEYARPLCQAGASVWDSLELLPLACAQPLMPHAHHHGCLDLEAVARARAERQPREKRRLRLALARLQEELGQRRLETRLNDNPRSDLPELELVVADSAVAPPDEVRALVTSVYLDFGEIPPEYLVPAGAGEYDAEREARDDPDAVWRGTYHEEGAFHHPEWDWRRSHYRKNWCVVRERDVLPEDPGFASRTLARHAGAARRLRRTFEALRDENHILRRQTQGEDVDLDALVDALANLHAGHEPDEGLYLHLNRAARDMATLIMVDMSGSTKGWINDAERESLILLGHALESLDDRWAVYGFSGIGRKRCEIFRIKAMDDPWDDTVRGRIAGIRPQDYTRMGAAVRHLSAMLAATPARTRLLITLSDGRPEDYHDEYTGRYGLEDTRRALMEARRAGIHPFCITLDTEAREYLSHLYGDTAWVLVNDVARLPVVVADVYRRLTRR